jgi:DNA gyrase/topoisomerase IV subunit B
MPVGVPDQVELDLGSGWVSVSDDGRGIPTGKHTKQPMSDAACLIRWSLTSAAGG